MLSATQLELCCPGTDPVKKSSGRLEVGSYNGLLCELYGSALRRAPYAQCDKLTRVHSSRARFAASARAVSRG